MNNQYTPIIYEGPELKRGTPQSAGVDLVAQNGATIEPGRMKMIKTGTKVAIPDGSVGLVTSRSGLANRLGCVVNNQPGIIDADYRGEILVTLRNVSDTTVIIEPGMRVAQLVAIPLHVGGFIRGRVQNDTERGEGGYGSTGR